MGKVAWIFPGQGAHIAQIGKYLPEDIKGAIRKRFGEEFLQVLEEGTEDDIKKSVYAQVGIMAYTYALARNAMGEGLRPDIVLGHSLGEYTAALVGGLTDFYHMLETVYYRAEYMDRYAPAGFILIVFKPLDQVRAILRFAPVPLYLSNINAPNQTLVGGVLSDYEKAYEFFRGMNWRVMKLNAASIPFHTPLMEPVREKFSEVIDRIPAQVLNIPLYSNALDEVITCPIKVKLGLLEGIVKPVNWVRAIMHLKKYGVDTVVEFAPRPVLAKLTRRIDRNMKTVVYEVRTVETKSRG